MDSKVYANFKFIFPYIKKYWFRALVAMSITIPIGSLDASIALMLKPYMDKVMVEKSMQTSFYIPFAIVAFTLIQGSLNYISSYTNAWVGGKVTNDIKTALFNKLLVQETGYFDKNSSGTVVLRYSSDADVASAGLLANIKLFTTRVFSSIALVGVLFYNSWQLAIIAVFILLLSLMPLGRIRKVIRGLAQQNVVAGANIITTYNETFAGIKTIQSYNLQDFQLNKFRATVGNIFGLTIKITKHTGWMSPIMHLIVSIGVAIVVGYGSHLIVTHTITSGNFVSFIAALLMLYTPLKGIGNNYVAVQSSFLALDRVIEILQRETLISDTENPLEIQKIDNSINFENVDFEYEPGKTIINNLSLEVRVGETLALVGSSGGGKSTLVNLIPRFYDVAGGKITIDGIDIRDISLRSLRDKMAVVFQDNFLFSGTIKENILLGNPQATEDEIAQALQNSYLDEFVSSLEHGIDTQIGERGVLLSGGQKQRVAIARALIKNAPIVILDEATSALDNKSEAIVQKAIDKLMENRTVIVIAHRLSTIQNATKIAVINYGTVAEYGSHNELVAMEDGIYRHLYMSQFKDKVQ